MSQNLTTGPFDRRHAETLANLMIMSNEAILAWAIAGGIELWNAGAQQLYGYHASEALGRVSHDLLKTRFPVALSEIQSSLLSTSAWFGELQHVSKDGREVTVESRMQLLQDGTVIEINRDITHRKRIEAALVASEKHLRWHASIVESSDDAIVSKDLNGIISSWNKGAERIFGFTSSEAIGQPITIVIPDDRLFEEIEILTRIRKGERIEHFETIRRRKDGTFFPISLSVSPVKDANGEILGASKIARDISEQRRNQETIITLAREAEHRSRNLLASVLAAVKLSRAETIEELKGAIEGRIQALANVHSLFAETHWAGADLKTIAERELAPYKSEQWGRICLTGSEVVLSPDVAQALAVTLHELATNAAKYGALSRVEGVIDIQWSIDAGDQLKLAWRESGGPPVHVPTTKGFGSRVIHGLIAQLNGSVDFSWRPAGLLCEICLKRS
jgi:PAS domain S-box-containing protein